MSAINIDAIERQISALPRAEQVRLIERVVHQLAESLQPPAPLGSLGNLEEMAIDPDIVRECAAIDREFGPTELDGLHLK